MSPVLPRTRAGYQDVEPPGDHSSSNLTSRIGWNVCAWGYPAAFAY